MQKFTSKAGVVVEAHVVTEPGGLQATVARGVEQLSTGDALIKLDGQSYAMSAPVFAALFGAESSKVAAPEAHPEHEPKHKGGQHAPAATQEPPKSLR
jgi:hypothetical protein